MSNCLPKITFSLSRLPPSTKSGDRIWEDRGSSWQKLGCWGQLSPYYYQDVMARSVCIGFGFNGGWVGCGKVKITSAPGPDPWILNWNILEWLKIDLECTRNGPGLDLDQSFTIRWAWKAFREHSMVEQLRWMDMDLELGRLVNNWYICFLPTNTTMYSIYSYQEFEYILDAKKVFC